MEPGRRFTKPDLVGTVKSKHPIGLLFTPELRMGRNPVIDNG
jgi:hypothetical protein